MADNYVKVKSTEVRGLVVDVYVDSQRGTWCAFKQGETKLIYSAQLCSSALTLDALMTVLKQKLREKIATVKVPFERINGREVQPGYVRGISQKDRELLVTWADGTKDQISSYDYHDAYLRPLSDDERAGLVHALGLLCDARGVMDRAEKWVKLMVKPYKVDLDGLTREAIRVRTAEIAAKEVA